MAGQLLKSVQTQSNQICDTELQGVEVAVKTFLKDNAGVKEDLKKFLERSNINLPCGCRSPSRLALRPASRMAGRRRSRPATLLRRCKR